MQVIRRGAEAEIRLTEWKERTVVIKSRVPKGYRHQQLDASLRTTRTKNEARLIQEARRQGIPTPIIFDIDMMKAEMTMEYIDGERVKDALNRAPLDEAESICREIGRLAALMHRAKLVHGDLTTSNMILRDGKIWIIDFSLGSRNAEVEEMGVDMHLLKEAFRSAHSERFDLFKIVMKSYSEHFDRSDQVVSKIQDIENRGRYT